MKICSVITVVWSIPSVSNQSYGYRKEFLGPCVPLLKDKATQGVLGNSRMTKSGEVRAEQLPKEVLTLQKEQISTKGQQGQISLQ